MPATNVFAETALSDHAALMRNCAIAIDNILCVRYQIDDDSGVWDAANLLAGPDRLGWPEPHSHTELMQAHWSPAIPSPQTIAIAYIADGNADGHRKPVAACDAAIQRILAGLRYVADIDPVPYAPQTNPGGPWTPPVNRSHPLFQATSAIHRTYAYAHARRHAA